jgi:hypothetical protein
MVIQKSLLHKGEYSLAGGIFKPQCCKIYNSAFGNEKQCVTMFQEMSPG